MNKQQIEALIDRLADKTLSFGCTVVVDHIPVTISHMNHAGNYLVLWEVGKDTIVARTVKEKKIQSIIGHPIYLHRVLQYLKAKNKLTWTYNNVCSCWKEDCGCPSQVTIDHQAELLVLWHACNIEKSLQEIVEESGWESPKGILDASFGKAIQRQLLKSPEAQALFTYLESIG